MMPCWIGVPRHFDLQFFECGSFESYKFELSMCHTVAESRVIANKKYVAACMVIACIQQAALQGGFYSYCNEIFVPVVAAIVYRTRSKVGRLNK